MPPSVTTLAYDITSGTKPDPGGVARYANELVTAARRLLLPGDRLLLGFRSSRWRHRAIAHRWRDERTRVRCYPRGCGFYAFGGADVYHGLGVHVPSGLWGMPKIATLHAVFQDAFERGDGGRGTKTLRAVERADALILPSEYDRRRAIELLGLPEDRTVAIWHGVDPERFTPKVEPARDAAIRANRGLRPGRPYVICVGGWNERKNYLRLAQAFRAGGLHTSHDLVLAGRRGRRGEGLAEAIAALGLEEAVRATGFVSHEELPALLRGAEVAAFPSLMESFGLPAVEAMACGTPLVFANSHALPEVVGDAGYPCDPLDVDSIGAALAAVIGDTDRREQLRALGLARAARFTWTRCARRTFALYERLTGRPIETAS
jgi:glycosyltransferase involved in cell wall biosynthesis